MKILIKVLILLTFLISSSVKADDVFGWMTTGFGALKGLLGCIEVPQFTNFQEKKISLNISTSGEWQSTGSMVEKGKLLKMNWSSGGITAKPKKYLVLYRIDPRFANPQVYIKSYNYVTKQYEVPQFPAFKVSDSPAFKANLGIAPYNIIPADKDLTALAFTKMSAYVDYFVQNNSRISVSPGDVINISLVDNSTFFGTSSKDNILTRELDTNIFSPSAIYTESNLGNFDNRIIYSSAEQVCGLIASGAQCVGTGADTRYKSFDKMILVGKPMLVGAVHNFMGLINRCPDNASLDNKPSCYYDQGRGMEIKIGNQVIKSRDARFVGGSNTQNSFIYHQADSGGDLLFTSNWKTSGMFGSSSLMSEWAGDFSSVSAFMDHINQSDWLANFLYFGRYTMIVEIGNGNNIVNNSDLENIKVEYLIVEAGQMPNNSDSGSLVSQDFSIDANKGGYLWLRVVNSGSNLSGAISLDYANYTGTTWFSNIVYTGAVKPITDQFKNVTENIFIKLVKNSIVQFIIKASLTLYVTIFGLMFTLGAIRLTAQELVTRIVKIAVVTVLLHPGSWDFFNKYIFDIFINGIDYFVLNVIGVTSSKANIFGFIDPIFDKFTNARIWGLLFIQLLQIQNGLTFVAIITIYALVMYFRAVLEVIVGYIVAFVGISVMISLAPFFIILILFEKTKSLFDNWLSTLLSYVIQPTILLIFFLFIDQIISEQLLKIVVRACWDILVPIKVGLDLNHLGIPINFSFTLPFLPGIPFFIPDVPAINSSNLLSSNTNTLVVLFTTALLFYSYCLMSYGLVSYVTTVVGQLTHVSPVKIAGARGAPASPISSIISDMKTVTTPITNVAMAPIKTFKNKVIDQRYRARPSGAQGREKEYTSKLYSSRSGDDSRE